MIAAIYTEYGSPSVLKVKVLDAPVPKDNELLVRVYASTVNRTVLAMLKAEPAIMRLFTGLFKPRKEILGIDFAGVVEGVGKDVKLFKVGDRVFGLNDDGLSSHAQYLTISAHKAVVQMAEKASFVESVANLEGGHYAVNFLNKIKIHPNDKVLVNGATGAIGSALVQLLKADGVHVTAVCGTENVELVKSLGADVVIDFKKEDFTKLDTQFNYVFDAVGKSSFSKCKPLLIAKGVYISSELGWMAENIFYALFTPLFGGKRVAFPIPIDCKRSVQYIKNLIEEGKLKAVVDQKYTLETIAQAYTYTESGEKVGSLVVEVE